MFQLTTDNVYEVLQVADLYLLPGLARQCGVVIGQYLDVDTVVSSLQTARLFNLCRLETICAEFMAANIEKVNSYTSTSRITGYKWILPFMYGEGGGGIY